MARPKGYRLNTPAFEFALRCKAKSRTEVARIADTQLSFISDLATGRYGASITKARALAEALDAPVGMLFPEVEGYGPKGEAA